MRVHERQIPLRNAVCRAKAKATLVLFLFGVPNERKFNRFLEEAEEALLFLLLAPNSLALMTAQRAELQKLAPPSSQTVNTGTAHNFPAEGALMGGLSVAMPRANHRSVC